MTLANVEEIISNINANKKDESGKPTPERILNINNQNWKTNLKKLCLYKCS